MRRRDIDRGRRQLCVDAGRDLYVGARVGFAVAPRTLIYAKAGYTNARIRLDYDTAPRHRPTSSSATNLDGVRVGARRRAAIGPNAYRQGRISLFELRARASSAIRAWPASASASDASDAIAGASRTRGRGGDAPALFFVHNPLAGAARSL